MLKAFRALIVGLMLLSILVACGGSTAPSTGTTDSSSAAASSGSDAEASTSAASPSTSVEASASPEASTAADADATATMAGGEPVALPDVDPATVEGDIIVAGSSTVLPLSQAIAQRFEEDGYAGTITVDGGGSGAGISRFCEAQDIDIADSSRAIEEEEIQTCTSGGREPIEFRIGTDALAIVVSSENDFLTDVTTEELGAIFSTATNWSDVNPSYPNEPIQRFVPGTDSGTFDYFVEEIFDDDPAGILAAANLQQNEDDNVLVQGIEGSPYAIGFFGYAYYQENADRLNILNVNGVEPTEETAESNEYPLSRPLFIYSSQSVMDEKPQVAQFISYYLSNINDVIGEVGYFPASVEALNEAKLAWQEAAPQQ